MCVVGVIFGIILGDMASSVVVGIALELSALIIVCRERQNFAGSKLARWDFLFCGISAVFGNIGAALVIYLINVNASSEIQRSLYQSLFVVSDSCYALP